MHTIRDRRSDWNQGGYALILVMVSMVILTILGVTAISVAQMDMKIAQNLRHHRQLAYGAFAGVDQVREIITENPDLMETEYESSAAGAGRCVSGLPVPASSSTASVPNILDANGFSLATYTVEVCQAVCGQPPLGNDLGGTQTRSVILDVVATGTSPSGVSAQASVGAFLMSPPLEASCNGTN